ncbi:MAG: hypothetical protein J6Q59_07195 [Paludibacteraceae bacterium]|nr:hypothetical protein [Paludibacteraceae bacterium]
MALKDPVLQQGFEIICKENAELKSIAEFQQSSNMSRYFENKKLNEVLTVGSVFNKALNSRNKFLKEEVERYRNTVFDKIKKLDEAEELILKLSTCLKGHSNNNFEYELLQEAERFLEKVSNDR